MLNSLETASSPIATTRELRASLAVVRLFKNAGAELRLCVEAIVESANSVRDRIRTAAGDTKRHRSDAAKRTTATLESAGAANAAGRRGGLHAGLVPALSDVRHAETGSALERRPARSVEERRADRPVAQQFQQLRQSDPVPLPRPAPSRHVSEETPLLQEELGRQTGTTLTQNRPNETRKPTATRRHNLGLEQVNRHHCRHQLKVRKLDKKITTRLYDGRILNGLLV